MFAVLSVFILFSFISSVISFHGFQLGNKIARSFQLNEVPLELKDVLDASRSWPVKFIFQGQEKIIQVSEGTCFLEVGEQNFDGVQSSCRNGVCTTCAGKVLEGRENVKLAVHGLGKPEIDAGFVCTCQSYVVGEGVVVKLDMYDEAYESQYGQYELSYEMKFGAKKEEPKKNIFGW